MYHLLRVGSYPIHHLYHDYATANWLIPLQCHGMGTLSALLALSETDSQSRHHGDNVTISWDVLDIFQMHITLLSEVHPYILDYYVCYEHIWVHRCVHICKFLFALYLIIFANHSLCLSITLHVTVALKSQYLFVIGAKPFPDNQHVKYELFSKFSIFFTIVYITWRLFFWRPGSPITSHVFWRM